MQGPATHSLPSGFPGVVEAAGFYVDGPQLFRKLASGPRPEEVKGRQDSLLPEKTEADKLQGFHFGETQVPQRGPA